MVSPVASVTSWDACNTTDRRWERGLFTPEPHSHHELLFTGSLVEEYNNDPSFDTILSTDNNIILPAYYDFNTFWEENLGGNKEWPLHLPNTNDDFTSYSGVLDSVACSTTDGTAPVHHSSMIAPAQAIGGPSIDEPFDSSILTSSRRCSVISVTSQKRGSVPYILCQSSDIECRGGIPCLRCCSIEFPLCQRSRIVNDGVMFSKEALILQGEASLGLPHIG
ncbi:hypothetical protein VTL71DRAFT_5006 [Oculimacula yallundae]|uniref:Uncharacterized protein n=1 Tax=Oculimacula yallundae TaxID=86028 RepID=A0ABR4C000_9HELO